MKEHNTSRIHSIRHPSPVNTHQSLCAHNLITKHVAAAKQPPYFRGLLQTQARGDGCLYSGNIKPEDRGGAGRVVHLRQLLLRCLFPFPAFVATTEPSQLTFHLMGIMAAI